MASSSDMFVKRRAKAAEYFGKTIASPIVTMYDGAAGVKQTGSFLFDDEGNLGTKTLVIENGVLVSGFSDSLSALALGMPATGNGRRQAYDHKAYARMTNTYFAPGTSTLEEMIASTKEGWLIDRLDSGMEDPRNWGIQLIALVGKEIRDGKLTGRLASPVFCSGYVPDVLGAITMVSRDFELGGSGACGKGYKEFVKVSSGGPLRQNKDEVGMMIDQIKAALATLPEIADWRITEIGRTRAECYFVRDRLDNASRCGKPRSSPGRLCRRRGGRPQTAR